MMKKILYVINDPPTELFKKYDGLPGMMRTAVDLIRTKHPYLFPQCLASANVTGDTLDIDTIHPYQHRFDRKEAEKLFPVVDDTLCETYSCVFLSGSLYNASDKEPWAEAESAWLRELVRHNKMKVCGICFGHQILGSALGGTVGNHADGGEWGSYPIFFYDDDENSTIGGNGKNQQQQQRAHHASSSLLLEKDAFLAPLYAFCKNNNNNGSSSLNKKSNNDIDNRTSAGDAGDARGASAAGITMQITHGQSILTLPPSAVALAFSKAEPYHLVKFTDNVYGIQGHPEYRPSYVKEVLLEAGDDVSQLPFQDSDSDVSAAFVTSFLAFALSKS